ncbi:hypothetical protein FisN_12Hh090 [Fistulifera solaris]|uniref:Uncharacterized protein n=1 Tax=Fistulifera solaris TaxID=1519565 RepID=A0A1Z5KR13_FISSO|nr:hypothetical protein FisN_12Hh090 [Fistulifera solaris]|eukprot:GAX28542.1 hypothetical protein FisN_12Hh090 [Fistulifera solaris]
MALRKTRVGKSSSIVLPRGGQQQLRHKATTFHGGIFWTTQGILLGANFLGYLISCVSSYHYHVDMLGTGAFAAVAAFTFRRSPASSLAVMLWSVKLASFLLFRVVHHGGRDSRLNDTLADPLSASGFWIISWLWGVLVSLPHCLGAATVTMTATRSKSLQDAGLVLFAVGWMMETVADYQKWMFKQQYASAISTPYCNVGLWSWSQHPNWCGNLLLWFGIWMMNAPALISPRAKHIVPRYGSLLLSCLGPLFLFALFHGQATGWILPSALEATKQKYGYGTDLEYTKYVDRTPLLFPLI